MKILFIVSPKVFLHKRSGEIELKTLQIGFRLNGIVCDVIGLDADDFATYDAYFVFSLNDDLDFYLNGIEKDKYIFCYPQTEIYDDSTTNRLKYFKTITNNFFVVARNSKEKVFYQTILDNNFVISSYGYFLEPFIFINKTIEIDLDRPYILSFIGSYDKEMFELIEEECKRLGYVLYLFSSEVMVSQKLSETTIIHPHVQYMSESWYKILSSCSFFYEPNNRLTNSLLEALYFSKKIISPNSDTINHLFGKDIAMRSISSHTILEKTIFNENLSAFRVENVAKDFLQFIKDYKN